MKTNTEGFSYPEIDLSKCVDCGRCASICPIYNVKVRPSVAAVVFVSGSPEIRTRAASGGAFSEIASAYIERGAVVAGVIDDADKGPRFAMTDTFEDLRMMSGSKYVQVDLTPEFQVAMRKTLTSGRDVLFCGTPCQAHAVLHLAENATGKLLVVDIACQGVPSPEVLRAYRSYVNSRHDSRLVSHRFRSKCEYHGEAYVSELEFSDGSHVVEVGADNLYNRQFQRQVSLRESCYSCPFSRPERVGNLTMGDYRGSAIPEDAERRKGDVSFILANDEAGQHALATLFVRGNVVETTVEDAVSNNIPLHYPVSRPLGRNLFYPLMRLVGFASATRLTCARYYIKRTIKRARSLLR